MSSKRGGPQTPRNPVARHMRQRGGVHGPTRKAQRRRDRQALKKGAFHRDGWTPPSLESRS